MLDALLSDVRFAFRLVRRNRSTTALSVGILALGIGANTAMFSALDAVLIRPLPFVDNDHLFRLRDAVVGSDGQLHPFNMRARSVIAVRDEGTAFDRLVAFSGDNMTWLGRDLPERLSVVLQTAGADATLGIRPTVGRGFTADEERRGLASGVALISDGFWQSHFGRSPSVLGASLRLDDRTFTIVGIMPPHYAFPYDAQVWVPFTLDAADTTHDFAVFAHTRRGVGEAQLRTDVAAVASRLRRQFADTLPTYQIVYAPIRDALVDNQAAPLQALSEVIAFLLLLASVNVATLLLARSVARRREFAVRAALGATRARHVQQLLVESLVLAGLGCALALLIVSWLAPLTMSLMPNVLSDQLGVSPAHTDWRVFGFAVIVSTAAAAIAGIVPAFAGSRHIEDALADGRRGTTGSVGAPAVGALIVAETALTMVLLVGAGLVIRHFVRMATTPLGFKAEGLVAIELTPPADAYPRGPVRTALFRALLDEIRTVPGLLSAAITTVNPLGGGTWGASIASEDDVVRDPSTVVNVNDRLVTTGLFDTMGIPIVNGRAFGSQDSATAQPVVIVSERLAHRLWPRADPIGRHVRVVRPGAPWLTVIGVAADVSDSHDPGVPLETWYRPLEQTAASPATDHVYLMVRDGRDPIALVPAIDRAVARVDRTLAPYAAVAMDEYRARSLGRERAGAAFMLGFGAFGLALAALGVYGLTAFAVAQRTTEFGIRMALGARRGDILPLALGRVGLQVAAGLVFGVVGAALLNRALLAVLTDVGPIDMIVVGGAAVLVFTAAVIACVVPALAAARLDPVTALKAE